jgi:hypothetical protein
MTHRLREVAERDHLVRQAARVRAAALEAGAVVSRPSRHDDPTHGSRGPRGRDLAAATAFFVEVGLKLQGEWSVEDGWVDRVVGLEGVRAESAMLETPDGHGRLELTKFHARRARAATGTRRRTPQASGISHSR